MKTRIRICLSNVILLLEIILLAGCVGKSLESSLLEKQKNMLAQRLGAYVANGQIAYGHHDDLFYRKFENFP